MSCFTLQVDTTHNNITIAGLHNPTGTRLINHINDDQRRSIIGATGAADLLTTLSPLFPLFILSLSSPLSLSLLSYSHSISFLSSPLFIGWAVLWIWVFPWQQGKLFCFTSAFFSHFLLSFSLLHREANNKDGKRHGGMLASEKKAGFAGCRTRREPFVAVSSCRRQLTEEQEHRTHG